MADQGILARGDDIGEGRDGLAVFVELVHKLRFQLAFVDVRPALLHHGDDAFFGDFNCLPYLSDFFRGFDHPEIADFFVEIP